MDNTDVKILNLLSQNSRVNASEISEKVKLSVSAVIERIKKLEQQGIILQYTLAVDNAKIGKGVMAMISVILDHPSYNDSFEAQIMQHKSIVECNYIAGNYDYLLKVVTTNTQSLERVLFDIKSIQGVSKTVTNVILKSIKNDHSIQLKLGKK